MDLDGEAPGNLRDHWQVLARRRWVVVAFAATVLLSTMLASVLSTPIFRAGLLLQIEREPAKVVQFQDITPVESAQDTDFYQTQFELLQSRSLAKRVIDRLNLLQEPSFLHQGNGEMASLVAWIGRISSNAGTGNDRAENRWIDTFLEHLSVEPIKNSRLVRLYYQCSDASLAAKIINALADNFIEMNIERRFEASAYAKGFLEDRLAQVQAKLEFSEQKLVDFARANGIVNIDDEQQINLQRLKQMNIALVDAEQARIGAEAVVRNAGKASDSAISEVLKNPLIQQLKQLQAELRAQYREKLKVFKPAYPAMVQLAGQIAEIRAQIVRETGNIRAALKNDYATALRKETRLKQRLGALTKEILAAQDRRIQYNILRREVQTNRELYDGLLQRMKEVGVAGGVSANNITVIDAADVPEKKYRPATALNMLIAAAIGLFGGIGLAFLLEHLDDTIKRPEDLERRARVPVFGAIPAITAPQALTALGMYSHLEPASGLAEAYRSVRTALMFSTPAGAPGCLLFTSPSPGEGKTTSALNVAITFAQMGRKVLLVDADLRNPSLHRSLGLNAGRGLTNFLVGDGAPEDIRRETNIPNLSVVTSGPVAPNPAELLSNAKMGELLAVAAQCFDHVILDGPPILGLADALVLANLAGGTVLVVEAGVTRQRHLQGALKRLHSAKATVIGGVLSKISEADSAYGYYANYYYYNSGPEAPQRRLSA